MNNKRWYAGVSGVLMGAAGMGLQGIEARAQEGPPALLAPTTLADVPPPPEPAFRGVTEGPRHEAWLENGAGADRVRAPKAPPAPLVERSTGDPPGPGSVWVPGYWMWEPSRQDFDWVSGAWKVPPADRIWVSGRWQRDAQGWSRVPGVWSPRQVAVAGRADWRKTGPPDPQADEPGQAPGADAFYVPGHYAPDGDRLTWTPGYWARIRAGFDWIPARWVRRPDGWDYREGYWTRDAGPVRHDVARPRVESDAGLPPAIVESDVGPTVNNDPIAAAESPATAPGVKVVVPPVVVGPGTVVVRPPYRYVGPYYRAPTYYDPLNVTPPFVRRFLDRVMP